MNRYRAALGHVLNRSVKWGWINENPMTKVDQFPEPNGRDRCLTSLEIRRLRDACKNSRCEHLETIFLIAVCTGMRKAEILNLTFYDVDLERRYIRVKKTKNGSPRSIPISNSLLPHLQAIPTGKRNQLLFPSPNDSSRPVCIKTAYSNAVHNAGLRDYTFHDNRHTAASLLSRNGVSLLLLAEIFGWKSLEMAKRYAYLQPSTGVDAINHMNKEILEGDNDLRS